MEYKEIVYNKIKLSNGSCFDVSRYETNETGIVLYIYNTELSEVEKKFTEDNLSNVILYSQTGEEVACIKNAAIGDKIFFDRSDNTVCLTITEKDIVKKIKVNSEQIQTLNISISDLEDLIADLIGGAEE